MGIGVKMGMEWNNIRKMRVLMVDKYKNI